MRNLILFLFIILFSKVGYSQVANQRLSPSFEVAENFGHLSILEIPNPDLTIVKQEDKLSKNNKEIPWRFGVHIPLEISTKTHGYWTSINGWSRWNLTLKSIGATSLNLNFNK